jgi:hypothetical protein
VNIRTRTAQSTRVAGTTKAVSDKFSSLPSCIISPRIMRQNYLPHTGSRLASVIKAVHQDHCIALRFSIHAVFSADQKISASSQTAVPYARYRIHFLFPKNM